MANDNGNGQGAMALLADDLLHVAWRFVLCVGLVGLTLACACLVKVGGIVR